MSLNLNSAAAEFLDGLPDKDKNDMNILLDCVRNTGFTCEARYYQKIIMIVREGTEIIGFSPRKGYLSLYLMNPEAKKFLPALGKVSDGRSCVRIKKITDIDLKVLTEMLAFMLEAKVNWYGNVIKDKK